MTKKEFIFFKNCMYAYDIFIHVCNLLLHIDPPVITAINIMKVCTNDFTTSWTAAGNEEGISYNVILFSNGTAVFPVMDTSYNFTELMPNTNYIVSVASISARTCVGIPDTATVTTLMVEAGVPQSE